MKKYNCKVWQDRIGCLHILPVSNQLQVEIKDRFDSTLPVAGLIGCRVNDTIEIDCLVQREQDIDFFWDNVSNRQRQYVNKGFTCNILVQEEILGCLYGQYIDVAGLLL